MFGKNKQKGITWKIRKEEQSLFCATHRRDLIHIPIKLHEDIPNVRKPFLISNFLLLTSNF